ncbi:hypothetical protein BCU84_06460 [Shewanella sp. 10N.286.51.B7]|uniref:prepilin-type N-terminal cleavage/methylation domain-containing protein n=1 Tax=Shewanella sp. 10N.286.51.B7 TaxID=1880836 RepID=UPI000C827015|nr:prepilin-type N-terminal cleavage/methylation domain-containing protein [Shewanella sp. 10N.286.51.B7]PMG78980.1 hypothetical protein BCU84_06460 [Shewanella sp. 10N.286.51.B7]
MSIKSVCYSSPLSNAHKGFTLIELVVVIIILAILAVIAAPKFISLKEDAYAGQMQGVSGAISSAKDLVYSACVISADCDETAAASGISNSIVVEGQNITLAYGYPRHTNAGIARAINIVDGDDFEVTSYSISGRSGLRIRPAADYSVNDCEIRYSEPQAAKETPVVERDLEGC